MLGGSTADAGTARASCVAIEGVPVRSHQVVEVTAPTAESTRASLVLYQRRGACLLAVDGPYGAWVGANGLSSHHLEGDDSTPTGVFGIGPVMYGADPNPGVAYPYHRLVCGDWWDEDPSTPAYNEFVHVACGTTPPFGGGSEPLWKETPAYDSFAVVAYNTNPRVPGRGSGIFIHQSLGHPTAGCISLQRPDLVTVLRFLDPKDDPQIAIRITPGPAPRSLR